jgi:hypothetical protein
VEASRTCDERVHPIYGRRWYRTAVRFRKQTTDAAKDENSVVFRTKQKAEFEELRDAVQAAISNRHAGAQAPQASSVADELAKLAELRNAGVLSPDEFEAQKARLLG